MKTIAICSFFVLFAIVAGIGATTPSAFAQAEVTIEPIPSSSGLDICKGVTEVECYVLGTITVDVGGKVIFSNTDSGNHAFVDGVISDNDVGELFKSDFSDKFFMLPGDEKYWFPDTVGEFPYFCLIHPWVNGLIIVQEAGAVEEIMEEEVMEETVEEETMMEETVEEETMMEETVEEETMMEETVEEGGGCLIATATFGSELAPQVQLLREIRDNQLMNTESGSAFMSGFNELYYSFSPYIADMQRENPMFKEAVKLGLTPLLSSLTIMENAESESEVLGLGLSVIALNLGMYIGLPAFGILKLYQIRKN
jgi:plastocyanin